MKKHLLASLMIAMACSNQLDAKNVYVKLSSDTEAWSHITQDENNVVVEITDGKFNGILSNIATKDRVWVAKGIYQVTGSINLNEEVQNILVHKEEPNQSDYSIIYNTLQKDPRDRKSVV